MALKKLAKAEAALSSVSSKSLKLRATTDLKEQAKVHIVAWGALRLTLFLDPAIKQVGSKGDSLRRALSDIWAQRGDNEGLLSALGEDVAKDIVETMKPKGGEDSSQPKKSAKRANPGKQ